VQNLVISNVPGPQAPTVLLGSEVKAMYRWPISTVGGGDEIK